MRAKSFASVLDIATSRLIPRLSLRKQRHRRLVECADIHGLNLAQVASKRKNQGLAHFPRGRHATGIPSGAGAVQQRRATGEPSA